MTCRVVRCCPVVHEDQFTEGVGDASIRPGVLANGALPSRSFRSSQGREIGYDGRVHLHIDDEDRVWIGGSATTTIHGSLRR